MARSPPTRCAVFVFTLLVAGSITTAYLIGSAVVAMAADPALLAPSRDDTAVIGCGRRGDAAPRGAGAADVPHRDHRRSRSPGITIPQGATVLAVASDRRTATRSVFADPDRFDPDAPARRAPRRSGTACTSAWAPRSRDLEARIAIEELLAVRPALEPADVTQLTSLVFRGPTELPLRLA